MEKLTENMIRFEERNKMIIQDFEPKHIEEAMGIALSAYNYERAFTWDLPLISSIPILKQLSENGLGVAAFEGGKMVGFLCSVEPFENAFRSTDVRGVFSPMGANGAAMENHGKIYAALYQAAAKKWVKAGAMSHAICLYEHYYTSPFFVNRKPDTPEGFLNSSERNKERYFAAKIGGELCYQYIEN